MAKMTSVWGFAGCHPAKFRQFRDQHGRGNRANAGDGPQKPCFCSRGFLLRHDAVDSRLRRFDEHAQPQRSVAQGVAVVQ
jgi:hypothetical protein